MYVICTVEFEERKHEIQVAVPDSYDDTQVERTLRLAVITALLERNGFLPTGVPHAVD